MLNTKGKRVAKKQKEMQANCELCGQYAFKLVPHDCPKRPKAQLVSADSLSALESFIDHEIEAMEESGKWSTREICALLALQARIDIKLTELGKPND